jgi:hypothetical protein
MTLPPALQLILDSIDDGCYRLPEKDMATHGTIVTANATGWQQITIYVGWIVLIGLGLALTAPSVARMRAIS